MKTTAALDSLAHAGASGTAAADARGAEGAEGAEGAHDADGAPARPGRLDYLDNLRWSMIILVLSMHACDTYGPFGNWYYREPRATSLNEQLAFGVYQTFLQAFFMAVLFFIAGYFTPAALERKGAARFCLDRTLRLGVPTLFYMLVLGPLTQYFLSHTWGTGGFAHQWLVHLADGEWLANTGPMWFCAALLMFSVAFALVPRRAVPIIPTHPPPQTTRNSAWVWLFVLALAGATFCARCLVSADTTVLNLQLGNFPQYVLMFLAGVFAAAGRWLERGLPFAATRSAVLMLAASVPLLAFMADASITDAHAGRSFAGGLNAYSAVRSLWESLVCVGMATGLVVLYRRLGDVSGSFCRFMSDNAFAVYLFHPPVIIGLALLLRGWDAPALIKAVALTCLTAFVTFCASEWVLRRVPGVKRFL